jgi:hypothetical protein
MDEDLITPTARKYFGQQSKTVNANCAPNKTSRENLHFPDNRARVRFANPLS